MKQGMSLDWGKLDKNNNRQRFFIYFHPFYTIFSNKYQQILIFSNQQMEFPPWYKSILGFNYVDQPISYFL